MKTLVEFKAMSKVGALTAFINDMSASHLEYMDHVDFLDGYYDLVESDTLYYECMENEEIIMKLKALVESQGDINFLFDEDLIDVSVHKGYSSASNELWSYSLGEQEVQLEGISSDGDCACIYSELKKDMSKEDLQEVVDSVEHYYSDDCVYIDKSYDRVSFVLKLDEFKEYLATRQGEKIVELTELLEACIERIEDTIIIGSQPVWVGSYTFDHIKRTLEAYQREG